MQDSRIDELRDTHRLEGSSQSTLITKLRSQLSTAESNLAARVAELSSLSETKAELTRAQGQIKEEEEKRSKAIQLLKTVRLKLVKAEKDKEEVEKDRAEERAERARATDEVEKVRAEKEREVQRLRAGFERELQGQKERWEREMKEKKAAWELEMITTKVCSLHVFSGARLGLQLMTGITCSGTVKQDDHGGWLGGDRQGAEQDERRTVPHDPSPTIRSRDRTVRIGNPAEPYQRARIPAARGK